MLAYPGDVVNTTLFLGPNREVTFSCTSFIAANNVCIASQIFFGAGSSLSSCSRKPVACRWSFIPANSSNSGSQGISDFIATTRVNIWFNSAPGSDYIKVSGQNNLGDVPSKSDPATMITLAAAGLPLRLLDHKLPKSWPIGHSRRVSHISGRPPISHWQFHFFWVQ